MVYVRVGLVHVPVGLWVLMDQGIPLWPKLIIEEGHSIDALAKNRPHHGPINNIDTIEKCRQLKTLTCNGTLRQVFIRVHRLSLAVYSVSLSLCTGEELPAGLPTKISTPYIHPPPSPHVGGGQYKHSVSRHRARCAQPSPASPTPR